MTDRISSRGLGNRQLPNPKTCYRDVYIIGHRSDRWTFSLYVFNPLSLGLLCPDEDGQGARPATTTHSIFVRLS